MLCLLLNGVYNSAMNQFPVISKVAFLARINDRARRVAVDTVPEMIDGRCRLMIIFDNGDREIFRGLKAA